MLIRSIFVGKGRLSSLRSGRPVGGGVGWELGVLVGHEGEDDFIETVEVEMMSVLAPPRPV